MIARADALAVLQAASLRPQTLAATVDQVEDPSAVLEALATLSANQLRKLLTLDKIAHALTVHAVAVGADAVPVDDPGAPTDLDAPDGEGWKRYS